MAKTSANTDPAYQAKLAHYRRLVKTVPGLELKGAANPYTSPISFWPIRTRCKAPSMPATPMSRR